MIFELKYKAFVRTLWRGGLSQGHLAKSESGLLKFTKYARYEHTMVAISNRLKLAVIYLYYILSMRTDSRTIEVNWK